MYKVYSRLLKPNESSEVRPYLLVFKNNKDLVSQIPMYPSQDAFSFDIKLGPIPAAEYQFMCTLIECLKISLRGSVFRTIGVMAPANNIGEQRTIHQELFSEFVSGYEVFMKKKLIAIPMAPNHNHYRGLSFDCLICVNCFDSKLFSLIKHDPDKAVKMIHKYTQVQQEALYNVVLPFVARQGVLLINIDFI